MKISAKAEYACLAMGELALRHETRTPVSLKSIAEQYGLSHAFLMQIFLLLRGGRLVQSVRGSAGGYQLARDPKEILLSEIVAQIDGPTSSEFALAQLPAQPMCVALRTVWQNLTQAEVNVLQKITLFDLTLRCATKQESDYQI